MPDDRQPSDEAHNLRGRTFRHAQAQTEESLLDVGHAASVCIRQALAGEVPDNAVQPVPDRVT
ncbi:hypothetical protein JNUCC0626_47375 [Lentzea sp. JNUCC 0626]|uniref:hypothetical protein n=1 Tax=Lentzea sp. JNUCC 0626 TaxID=3367513 RepID=UPI00374A01CD